MKKIVIVCAGAYGKEVYTIINSINEAAEKQGQQPVYELLGFLDDNPDALKDSGIATPIIGRISDWQPIGDEVYAIGAAFSDTKIKLVHMLKERGCRFETLIAPWSIVASDCIMGEGCFITAYSISAGVRLGNFVNINGSMLCPGTRIGDFSTTTGFTVVEGATIGESVFVGSHAVIAEGVRVGDRARISTGSIVLEDVRPGALMFGVPAVEMA